jgi:hypothetical protein
VKGISEDIFMYILLFWTKTEEPKSAIYSEKEEEILLNKYAGHVRGTNKKQTGHLIMFVTMMLIFNIHALFTAHFHD